MWYLIDVLFNFSCFLSNFLSTIQGMLIVRAFQNGQACEVEEQFLSGLGDNLVTFVDMPYISVNGEIVFEVFWLVKYEYCSCSLP